MALEDRPRKAVIGVDLDAGQLFARMVAVACSATRATVARAKLRNKAFPVLPSRPAAKSAHAFARAIVVLLRSGTPANENATLQFLIAFAADRKAPTPSRLSENAGRLWRRRLQELGASGGTTMFFNASQNSQHRLRKMPDLAEIEKDSEIVVAFSCA